MNHFLKTVLKEEEVVEVIMEKIHLEIERLLPEVQHLTGKDWKAFTYNKNDLQVINNRKDVLKSTKTMAYWVSL
jgi:hypothetical protein